MIAANLAAHPAAKTAVSISAKTAAKFFFTVTPPDIISLP
jgi:hypothetical protein